VTYRFHLEVYCLTSVRVKICGITNTADGLAALNAGAHAIGLVFYEPSPRFVSIELAKAIAYSLGPFAVVTGLFVNADPVFVKSVLKEVPLQLLQFHGDEDSDYCESFQRPYMKALRMKPELDVVTEIARFNSASGILLDAYRPGIPGGTGETFDWARVPKQSPKPIVLAGGLDPTNVALAIKSTAVYGVDVSGGVEKAPGKKDHQKINSFIQQVNNAAIK
jgi:phosphoribosylanthranilate isomerase